jgi:hypothetical protein
VVDYAKLFQIGSCFLQIRRDWGFSKDTLQAFAFVIVKYTPNRLAEVLSYGLFVEVALDRTGAFGYATVINVFAAAFVACKTSEKAGYKGVSRTLLIDKIESAVGPLDISPKAHITNHESRIVGIEELEKNLMEGHMERILPDLCSQNVLPVDIGTIGTKQ